MACCIPGCSSRINLCPKQNVIGKKHNADKVSFHRFPMYNIELTKLWIKNIKENCAGWEPPRDLRICSLHFDNTSYRHGAKTFLHLYAVPTIFKRVSSQQIEHNATGIDKVKVESLDETANGNQSTYITPDKIDINQYAARKGKVHPHPPVSKSIVQLGTGSVNPASTDVAELTLVTTMAKLENDQGTSINSDNTVINPASSDIADITLVKTELTEQSNGSQSTSNVSDNVDVEPPPAAADVSSVETDTLSELEKSGQVTIKTYDLDEFLKHYQPNVISSLENSKSTPESISTLKEKIKLLKNRLAEKEERHKQVVKLLHHTRAALDKRQSETKNQLREKDRQMYHNALTLSSKHENMIKEKEIAINILTNKIKDRDVKIASLEASNVLLQKKQRKIKQVLARMKKNMSIYKRKCVFDIKSGLDLDLQ